MGRKRTRVVISGRRLDRVDEAEAPQSPNRTNANHRPRCQEQSGVSMENAKTEKVSFSHHKIHTDILIDASTNEVWAVLTDTDAYRQWAAFLVKVKGEISDGAKISTAFQMNPAKEKVTTIDHRITVVDGVEFFWAEKGPGGIRDNHHFKVEPTADGKTRFVQSDEIMGGLTWLMGGRLAKMYLEGYQAFNRGLKAETERRADVK